jgi:DHA3 family tetracycline resistance protein-like MFS transporter
MLRALQNRLFAFLWSGQTISRLGDSLYRIALSWWVLEKTGSALAMGTVNIVSMIPMLLFMLFGGVLVDRLPRPWVLFTSDLFRGIIVAVIAILAALNLLEVWEIFIASALFGLVSAFFEPAYVAIFPEIVQADTLHNANSLSTLSREIASIVGPSLGAFLVAAGGTPITFGLDALSFFISSLTLIPLLKITTPTKKASEQTGQSNVWGDLTSGIKTVVGSPWLWVAISIGAVANMMEGGTLSTSLPFLISDVWHMGVKSLGFINSAISIGAVLTAVIMGSKKKIHHRGWIAYLSWFSIGIMVLLLGIQKNFYVSLVLAAVIGIGATSFGLIWTTTMQEIVPKDLLGRVSSIDYLGSYILLPIGFAVAGWATDLYGPAVVFITGGSVIALMSALALLHPKIRGMD